MSQRLAFTIPGNPMPKGRPRFRRARLGAGGHTYTPTRTRHYEETARTLSLQAVALARWRIDPKARYALTVRLYFANARRVDVDNCAKACGDSLMPFVMNDDSAIYEWHAYKYMDPANPRAEVTVETLETE